MAVSFSLTFTTKPRLLAGIRTLSLITLVVCLRSNTSWRIWIRVASGSEVGNAGVSVKLNRCRAFLVAESSRNTTIFVLLTLMDILFFSAHCWQVFNIS
jgi:hypothetical protein